MNLVQKGLALALAHVAIVSVLGGKLLLDRATLPRVWVRTLPVDPMLPIRGRYVRLRVDPAAPPMRTAAAAGEALRLEPHPDVKRVPADKPLAYFIPEHVPDPSRRVAGEELWVEVTLPRKGPPRPIRLGVKKEGVLTPLVF
jgi:hypothetical protein